MDVQEGTIVKRFFTFVLIGVLSVSATAIHASEKSEKAAKTEKAEETESLDVADLTLERLFPEKGLFGPSARGMAFSHDGRYAAYLYRPYIERRHGNDLWLYDTQTGEVERLTSVSVMAEFQKATRKVREDRIKKAKKRRNKNENASNGREKENDQDADSADDGLSGEWDGRLAANENLDIPPEGLAFTLTVQVNDDDTVDGTFTTDLSTATVTEGTYDRAAGTLSLTLTDPVTGLTGVLKATISNADMTGTIHIESMNVTVQFTAERTVAQVDNAKTGDEREDDDEKDTKDDEEQHDDRDLGDIVGEDDADDEKAPRYGGIRAFVWSPVTHELIFVSAGDLYQFDIKSREITRLTRTRESERDVQYLPDGSGYTYLRGSALMRVQFNTHMIEQIDPELPGGESMQGYRISPDGTRLVFLATKGESYWSKGRRVNIVYYRKRFAEVRQVRRHMPDDPMPEFTYSIYLYSLDEHLHEDGQLKKVFTRKRTGPRDVLRVPEWSPDSSRVAFSVFEQQSGHIEIREAAFVEKSKPEADENENTDNNRKDDNETESNSDENEKTEYTIDKARAIYRLYHHGGPNTPRMVHPYYLADSRRLVFLTELSGFRHLHVLDPVYEQLDQLTTGRYEVYPIDISEDHKRLFVTSTKGDPAQEHVFVVDLTSGEMTRLSENPGVYSRVAVSDDGSHVLASHVDYGSLRELVAINAQDQSHAALTDSHPDEAHELTQPEPAFFTYKNRHGHKIHGHMFKPDDWSADDKRPLLIYVYGGPLGTRKMVTRGSYGGANYFFAYYMAKKHGYVTCTIDPRGVSGYGGLFEKANFEQVGRPQVEDLVDATEWFVEHHGVDPDRIGMHGWSFGGFQTQMMLYTEPDVMACGIAGAGPTEWYNYNSWYTTGTIGEKDNLDDAPKDEPRYSLLPLAKNLKADLLLVHGMEDSNVLYQDTVRIYRELLKAGKETLVELFLDPTGGHGLGGDVKALNRYRKYEAFLLRCLGERPTDHDAPENANSTEKDAARSASGD